MRLLFVLALIAVTVGRAAAAVAPPLVHDLNVRLQPATGEIIVADTIAVVGRTTLRLDLAPWLEVSELTIDGRAETVTEPVVLHFPDGGQHRVRLAYGGHLEPPRGERVDYAPRISGDGVFLPAFSGWLPRAGHETVSYRLSVEVPAGYRAVATGALDGEIDEANGYRATWVEDRPGEGPSLFAGPWQIRERRVGGVRYRTWFDRDNAHLAELYLERAAALVAHYETAIGPYPYTALHVVAAPAPVGLGFPGILYVSRRILPLPFMQGRSLAHEVLHNWWGNGVGVDYATGNWAEGLTTDMADHWLAREQASAEARSMRLSWLRDYRALPAGRDFPVAAFTARQHGASRVIGYNKTAFIFHMLRAEIGDPAFDAGVHSFWRDHRFGTAAWSDLRHAFESAFGRDLGWFFDQWLRRPGAPGLALDDVEVVAREGAFEVTVTVSQTVERDEDAAYRLSVPLVIDTPGQRIRETLSLHGRRATATFAVPEAPTMLAIDPDFDVFRRLTTAETPPILRDVTLDPAANVVVAAGPSAREAARTLAARMMEGSPRPFDADTVEVDGVKSGPLLVVGAGAELGQALAALDLGPVPPDLAGRGSARIWAGRRGEDQAYVIVAADDAPALNALIGPLPHYGRSGYLIFEGRRAIADGVRPTGDSPLTRRLAAAN